MTPDNELLQAFLNKGDEAAFAEVVRRHADLVYSVALRVTRNPALAQDATQTVFTILARKARSLVGYDTLVGWLHTTARHAAINVVRGEERRRTREQEASLMQNESSTPSVNWAEIGPHLDEAVDSLHEADRKAILLRFFANYSHQDIGEALGLAEDSARKRVERALEKLKAYFARRGVVVSSTLLATSMAENSVQAAPTGLAESVAGTSLAGAGAASGSILFTILFMSTKAKLLTAAAIILAIVATIAINWPKADSSTSTPEPLRATSMATETVKPVAQVEKPVVNAVAPSGQPLAVVTTSAPPIAAVKVVAPSLIAEPQTDLKAAISTGIHFLNAQDTLSFFKTLMPPNALGDEGKKGSLEDFVKQINQSPNAAKKLSSMLEALNTLQDKTPAMNEDGTRATYQLDPPVAGHKVVIFNKIGDFWYLDGI